MTDDELDAGSGEFVGDRDALPRVGGIIADRNRDLLLEDAAGCVDVGDGELSAVLELRAEGGVLAGEGAGQPELDLRLNRRGRRLRRRGFRLRLWLSLCGHAEHERESETKTRPSYR